MLKGKRGSESSCLGSGGGFVYVDARKGLGDLSTVLTELLLLVRIKQLIIKNANERHSEF